MAFEQNPQLNRLVNPMGQQQFPTQGMGVSQMQMMPFQQQNQGRNQNQGFLSRLGSGLSNFFGGTPQQQLYSFPHTQQQYGAYDNLLQQGQQNMNNPYEGFEPIRKQIMEQFYNEILPGISSRFGAGALSSPDFTKQLGTAGQGLASMLAAHQANFGQQNKQFGLQQTQLGLTPQFESSFIPRQPGFVENALGAVSGGLGRAAGSYLGGSF
jgi:hypothetical protein